MIRNLTLGLLLLLAAAADAAAQERAATPAQTPAAASAQATASASAPTVTVSVSAKGVRFAALGSARQMRLEVFGADGESLYNSGFQAGSVRDWAAEDARGQSLADGAYLCVVTVRDVSGRLSVRQGSVVMQGGQVSLQLSEAEPSGAVEPEKGLAPVSGEAAVTLTAHDGQDGQLVTTRGALSFRAGDFFGGRDRELMRLTPEGNLGVGVARPEARLDVAGTIRARGGIQFDDGSLLTSAGVARRKAPGGQAGSAAGAADTFATNLAGTGTPGRLTKWFDSSTLMDSVVYETGGLVGIGTAMPNGNLDISSALPKMWLGRSSAMNPDGNTVPRLIFGDSTAANPGLFTFVSNDTAAGDSLGSFQWANYGLAGTDKRVAAVSGNLSGGPGSGSLSFYTANGGGLAEHARIDNAGNLGLGTASPLDRLHIAVSNSNAVFPNTLSGMVIQNTSPTNNNYSSIVFQNSAGGSDVVFGAVHIAAAATGAARRGAFVVATAGTSAGGVVERLRVDDAGNVGVGTASPAFDATPARFFAVDGGASFAELGVGGNQSGTNSVLGVFDFFNSSRGTAEKRNAAILGANDGAANNGNLQFYTANGGTLGERLRIDKAGNVGVGTVSPQARLDVAGDLKVSGNAVVAGNIAAKYQDVAEWVRARGHLDAGTVVVLDAAGPDTVAASARAYDTRVAGVVSAQPGLILGQGGAGKVLVATTGRVRVRVDATRRPVRVGDLLVTGPRPGMAMRSQPVRVGGVLMHRPGTIIGKALEPLAGGEGEILVLLSLQ